MAHPVGTPQPPPNPTTHRDATEAGVDCPESSSQMTALTRTPALSWR
jgi:hypothetical protein